MTRTAWTRKWPVKLAAIGLALGLLGFGSGWQHNGLAARHTALVQAQEPSSGGPPWG